MVSKRQARKCSAHLKSGEPCGAWAITGGAVCVAHGGRAAQVKRKAAERVAEAKAVAVFERYTGPSNGHSSAVNVLHELRELVARVTSFERFAHDLVTALKAGDWQQLTDPQTSAVIGVWERAATRAAGLLTDVTRVGILDQALRAENYATDRESRAYEAVLLRVVTLLGHDPRGAEASAAIDAALSEWLDG